tara:strand:+ start:52695 stop:55523 length:2829 start_codon:yes stop_codon:yes gene_type:complete
MTSIYRTPLRAAFLLASCSFATLAHAGELAGHVFDATETRALKAASVTVVELNRSVTTDRAGSYVIADIPAGDYTVEIGYVGAEKTVKTVSVPAQGRVVADFSVAAVGGGDILVIGQAANMASSLSRQKAADGVSSVLTRDAIGQFPDQNVAESLRRLPGVNILNDQGEGRFVSVRGLDPELNSSSLNGVRLPAPESDVRSVALDVVSSDIIESIEVKKSLTPDMDADTIGASIEITTTSAFDRKKDLYSAKIEGSYNDYTGDVTPKGSFDFSTKLGDNFGIAGGISYYKRKFETDNIEADGWGTSDADIDYVEEVEYRDYDVERERISAALSLDLRASDTTKLYARGNFSQFDDQEYRRRTTFKFDEEPSDGDANSALFDDADGEIEIERDVKDRFERQRIRSVVLGGETDTGEWKASYSASWAKSSEKENGSLDPSKFSRKFEGDGLSVLFDYSDQRIPAFSIPTGGADFVDAAGYELEDIEYTALSDSQDEEYALKADLGREFATGSGVFTIQGGAKMRWREKSYNKTVEFYENDALTLADVLGKQTYRIADIGPVASYTGASDYFRANRADFELQEIDSQFDSAEADYAITEDIFAAYLLGRWESSTLRVIGGVRYEHTKNDIAANTVLLAEEGASVGGVVLDDDTVFITPNSVSKKYDHWLPSLNIRFEPQPNLVLRAAGYRSIVRPKLSKLPPIFRVEQNDDDEREGEFGNPDLKPYEAWNFDAAAEYYFSGNGAITAGFFYKDVKNFIVDVNNDDGGVYNGVAFDEASIPINGDSAEIYGIELSYSQVYSFLPAPFDGLLTQLNYTYTDATGTVPNDGDITDPRKIALPSSSKHTFNAVLGYEKGPIDLRIAGTYRSKYLDELGGEAEEDRYVDNHFQIDISAKYKVSDNVRLFAEWVNVNNAKYFAYQNFNSRKRLLQYEEYGPTVKFGAKVTF